MHENHLKSGWVGLENYPPPPKKTKNVRKVGDTQQEQRVVMVLTVYQWSKTIPNNIGLCVSMIWRKETD